MKKLFTCSVWLLLVAIAATAWLLVPAAPAVADADGLRWLPLVGLAGTVNIRGLFVPAAIARYLKTLPVLRTPVMDTIFTNRPQHPFAVLGADDLTPVVHALPLVKRGGMSIAATKESGGVSFYEPLPIRPNAGMVTGADINNLRLMGQASQEMWAQTRTDRIRRAVRATSEALCTMSLTGRIQYPVQMESGGFDIFDIDFGAILSVVPAKLWSEADIKIAEIFEDLSAMQEKLQDNGYGGAVEIWAGKTAYSALFKAAESFKSTAKIRVEVNDQAINVGGFQVKRRSERYRNPQTGAMTPVVDDKKVKMIATDGGHFMPYCALDDLDSNLQPMPLLVKPIKIEDPSGYKLVGESKPFPVPNVKAICDATVTS